MAYRFSAKAIKELEDKKLVEKRHNNLENYELIIDSDIEVGSQSLEISLWRDGSICVRGVYNSIDLNVCLEKNRIVGTGARTYKDTIKEGIKIFKEKYKEVISYMEG